MSHRLFRRLKRAIEEGDIALIEKRVNDQEFKEIDVNQVDNEGNTLVNYAISQSNPKIIALIKSRQNLPNSENLDLPADWSAQGNIMRRALALGDCALLKSSEDFLQAPFQEISAALEGKDGIILSNDELYYLDQKQEKIQKIEQSTQNQAIYARLKARISATDSLTSADNEILQLTVSLIGHTPGGYKKTVFASGGVCFGISHMAMQAFMANDYDNFYRRMQLISAIPVDHFNEKIISLEAKRRTLTLQARQDFNQLNAEEKTTLEKANKEKIDSIKKEVKDWKLANEKTEEEANNLLNKKIEQLIFSAFVENKMQQEFSKDDLLLLDSRALFEGIALYQSPGEEPQLFNTASSQNVLITAPIVQSQSIEKQQGIVKCADFYGAYNHQRLNTYFESLQEAINKAEPPLEKNITLSLGNLRHSILVSFDPQKQKWYLVDPNGISKPFSEENLIKSFSDNKIAVFHTEVFSTQSDNAVIQPIIKNWMQGEKWKKAHHIDENTALMEDSKGLNLVELAIFSGQEETLRTLLQYPINLNKPLSNGETPLQYAILKDNVKITEMLLANATIDPNVKNKDGKTTLQYAFLKNNKEIIKMLLADKMLDPDAKDNSEKTPLQDAMLMNKNPEIIKMLLDDPRVDPNVKDKDGRTLLQDALLMDKNLEIIKLFLDNPRFDLRVKDEEERTLLQYAILMNKSPEIIKLFLDNPHVDLNAKYERGMTLLQHAIFMDNRPEIIEMISNHPRFAQNINILKAYEELQKTCTAYRDDLANRVLQDDPFYFGDEGIQYDEKTERAEEIRSRKQTSTFSNEKYESVSKTNTIIRQANMMNEIIQILDNKPKDMDEYRTIISKVEKFLAEPSVDPKIGSRMDLIKKDTSPLSEKILRMFFNLINLLTPAIWKTLAPPLQPQGSNIASKINQHSFFKTKLEDIKDVNCLINKLQI